MASLYQRPTSKFWWVKYRDSANGKIERESTKCRIGIGAHTRRAREICAEKTKLENQVPNGKQQFGWDAWVRQFLTTHYETSPKTLCRYLGAWKTLALYLAAQNVRTAAQLTYQHAIDYVAWRQSPNDTSAYRAKRSTALWELKTLRIVMAEALRRGMVTTNPCVRLGLKKGPTAQRPEITDDEIVMIRRELLTRPEWMQISFEIAIHQGCRFAETCLPLAQIDIEGKRITFDAKGGKTFTTVLHPNLIPLIERLKSTGRTRTFEMPMQTGREWTRFFRKIGLRHLCFHCTRVSVITRLCRAGVSQPQAMRFVGHASETIHRIYQRLRAEDVTACVSALRIPLSENPDAPSAKPKRARASSASRNRTEIRPNASPKRTTPSDRCARQAVLR